MRSASGFVLVFFVLVSLVLLDQSSAKIQKRTVNPARIWNFQRNERSPGSYVKPQPAYHTSGADPMLQGLTTAELYRMLEILDMVERQKLEKVTPDDIMKLEMLMAAYGSDTA